MLPRIASDVQRSGPWIVATLVLTRGKPVRLGANAEVLAGA